MEEYPKVLVISHNPFSNTQNNGKTLTSFFKGWKKENIAQLYFTYDIPDYEVCENFYRITDLDVLKSAVRGKDYGDIYLREKNNVDEKKQLHKNALYRLIRDLFKQRLPFMYCVRNFFWSITKPWKKKKLNEWINKFKPDIVFFQSSNVYSIFKLVWEICQTRNIPLIMETTDDYVTAKFSISPFFWYNYLKMKKWYKKLVRYSKCIFAIGDKMKEEYTKRFGGNYKVAMNCIDLENRVKKYKNFQTNNIKFLYAGNLGLNRWKTLNMLGQVLKKLREEKNINGFLEIYSIEKPNQKILNAINIDGIMKYMGSLNSEELIEKRNEADVLLHVESFDKKNVYITRLSVSTKIPEYLASERCILAIGPKNIASIQYLQDNDAGIVITDLELNNVKENVLKIIEDSELRVKYSMKNKNLVKEKHNLELNRKHIQEEIKRALL